MKRRYQMLCGLSGLEHEVAQGLTHLGLEVCSNTPKTLLIDAPWGWALPKLQRACHKQTVVVSDNPCAEYRLELLTHHPAALLSGVSVTDIAAQLKGTADYQPPILASPLTPTERLTLHLLASGRSSKQIAKQRSISEGRVKNTVGSIYQKLGLKSKVHLALYYFGLWHALEAQGWERPGHPRD